MHVSLPRTPLRPRNNNQVLFYVLGSMAIIAVVASVVLAVELTQAKSLSLQSYDFSEPKYPSPWGSGVGEWADAYDKARAFVAGLTLLEKVNLTTGTG